MKISVVIPLYNKADKIERTLKSVFAQTFTDYEIIIVDDGSTDNSSEIVEKFNDARILLIRQKNAGVSAARNRGICEAKGEYIAFLDADDEWLPEYLEEVNSLREEFPYCNAIAINYIHRYQTGKVIPTIIRGINWKGDRGILDNYFEVASQSHPPIWTSAVSVRKDALKSVGGFPEEIKAGEDLLTWARLACRNKIAYSRRPLAIFNIEGFDVKEKPKRIPPDKDFVGDELVLLRDKFHIVGMNRYLSIWYKMRSSNYMRLGMRSKSIREAIKGLRCNILNYKLYAYIVINLLPNRFQPFSSGKI